MLSPHIVSEQTRSSRPEKTSEAPILRTSEAGASAPPLPGAIAAAIQAPDIATILKDGHYARQRDGAVVGPLRALDPGGIYAYACDGEGWMADGRYNATSDTPHPRDLLRVLPQKA